MEVCTGKLNRYKDRKLYEMLTLNETVQTTVTSSCLSITCLNLKIDRTQNKLLHNNTDEKYKHHG
jgi:hypothetical protein